MIWRSLVGKLWLTILLLVSFVLFVLTILLLEFLGNFHVSQAEKDLMETATKVSDMVEQLGVENDLTIDTVNRIKDPSSRIAIVYNNQDIWLSDTNDNNLSKVTLDWLKKDKDLSLVLSDRAEKKKLTKIPNFDDEVMIVGTPILGSKRAVFAYQSLNAVEETSKQTTQIIFLGAGIAFILTTVFAFFLSTRITSPLIKMREGAFELARGEFNTKVPILTHDEIGELAMAFNRMGRQLKFHINALRQEKEQLSGILSSMADGVITVNRKGDISITNPPAQHFLMDFFYEKDVQQDINGVVLPKELISILEEVISTEKEVMREINLQGRSWVMIMTPLYDQTYIRGAVAVIRDMTEERRLDTLREDFIANVSHELRTPISMLQGYSEAIVDDVAVTREEKNELASIIYEESLRMGRLVNQLLDLAQMEAGHLQLQLESVKLMPFLERIVKKFKGLTTEHSIALQLTVDKDIDELSLDPDRIEQVLTNLIDNAIRHTNQHGTVEVVVSDEGDSIRFSIMDTGSGIPQEDLPFVFERFYKADKSRKRKNGNTGTGLGLAIAKNIVESHNGTISAQSKKQEGTTFSFQLPKNHENA
ncbi:cell wall metabolism sensor histidine kinase WalK [Aquibacillus sp. 3ASR75-11]|uniref:histidine kinase n=1 Tax=Terrihalobacillus insolitus TaxID=2950438 RepID=A0A9X3WVH2_9BACI|nr:ATP-binding protein [Terrihalobacillus insolitus]MDC3413089.1 cell wall metabolism sensor histidine kinase WalK [Terrihalobacillus insolitus]MDC3424831.1 cell wall metabolism sensor histidine kinase WalK [Terrihalobacillus insolitus]